MLIRLLSLLHLLIVCGVYLVLHQELEELLGKETVLKVWGVLAASQVPVMVALLLLDYRVSEVRKFSN